jgi:hypothetical protein
MIINTSTSRRQGRIREDGSEGSPSANLRADEQKRHIRPSLRVSGHIIAKPWIQEVR